MKRLASAADIDQKEEILKISFNSEREEKFLESLCNDLKNSGWEWEKADSFFYLQKTQHGEDKSKENVRRIHQIYRDIQLSDPSVRSFIINCNTSRYFKNKRVSIKSLIADGTEIVNELQHTSSKESYDELPIKPYIQEASSSEKCDHTGFYLSDIWRYFRHTWSTEYRSIPGRKLNLLIRDASKEFHPVIGILGLTSPVLNLGVRDQFLGISNECILKELQGLSATMAFEYINSQIQKSFEDIYLDDLLAEGIICYSDLKVPTLTKIKELESKAQELSKTHSRMMVGEDQSFADAIDLDAVDILDKKRLQEACISPLFKGKRLKYLSGALKALKAFKESGPDIALFANTLKAPEGDFIKDVVGFILIKIKNERLGSNILDLSVCGSIAPYSFLLGGKLVSLLAGSPEVEAIYKKNYQTSPSIIASIMANKPIYKNPSLLAITTTSLYASGSSQYNRIKIPRNDSYIFNPKINEPLEYKNIGTSEGFGTFQFSSTTILLAEKLNNNKDEGTKSSGTRANSIFGEGASPRLRKIREILDKFKIPGDKILNHSYKRIVYVYSLVKDIQKEIFKINLSPEYILTQENPKAVTEALCLFWFQRWAVKRISQNDIANAINQNSFKIHGTHNAYVNLPCLEND